MKPGSRDFKVKMLISGKELDELQKHAWSMCEAFGLDSRIEKYKGEKPIGFYQWDMECLLDVLSMALEDTKEYPDHSSSEYLALRNLYEKLKAEYSKNWSRI